MRNVLTSAAVALALAALSNVAFADVSSLTARFAGGCSESNTTGSCAIKVSATGSDLGSEGVLLLHSDTLNGHYAKVSKNARSLSDSGQATFRFRNAKGCYKVTTAENGNDKPDVTSHRICEK